MSDEEGQRKSRRRRGGEECEEEGGSEIWYGCLHRDQTRGYMYRVMSSVWLLRNLPWHLQGGGVGRDHGRKIYSTGTNKGN